MIVPGRMQRLPRRPGHADYAHVFLHDMRFDEQEKPRPEFILNQPAYRNTGILVTGPDFGCGSSRESAAYATLDFGVRALIGTSFGDVYRGNCMQHGVLTLTLAPPVIQSLFAVLRAQPGVTMTVDLPNQTVIAPDGSKHRFDIDPTRKLRLTQGLDDIGVTLQHLPQIEAFEAQYRKDMPWLAHIV
jgi:3-isopropylmalate/(R)-2-methylmalate dehydratase small subunit